jgi:hypothetical protein
MYKYFLFFTLHFLAFSAFSQEIKKEKVAKKSSIKITPKKKKSKEKTTKKETKHNIENKDIVINKPVKVNGKYVTGTITTVEGYRVCIYNGTDRAAAFAVKQQFIQSNNKFNNYLVYSRPYFKIKVGDFEDKKSATKALRNITIKYPNAFLVPDLVTIKNIEVWKKKSN